MTYRLKSRTLKAEDLKKVGVAPKCPIDGAWMAPINDAQGIGDRFRCPRCGRTEKVAQA